MRANIRQVYDYYPDKRRSETKVYEQDGVNWTEKQTHRFYYDEWNVIREEIDYVVGDDVVKKYLWGLDIGGQRTGKTQSRQAAGGVGGLLAITVIDGASTKTYFPIQDHQGNIHKLYDPETETFPAEYTYSPFGELIGETGIAKDACPFRYSSKYYDKVTQLYYYGYRFYNPATAKWLSREPLGKGASVNLLAFCENDPVNSVDVLGLDTIEINGNGEVSWVFTKSRFLLPDPKLGRVKIGSIDVTKTFIPEIGEDVFQRASDSVTLGESFGGFNISYAELVAAAKLNSLGVGTDEFGATANERVADVTGLVFLGKFHSNNPGLDKQASSFDWVMAQLNSMRWLSPHGSFAEPLNGPEIRKDIDYLYQGVNEQSSVYVGTQDVLDNTALGMSLVTVRPSPNFLRRINLRHVFVGEINRRGRAVGFHHRGSIGHQGKARVTEIIDQPNARGVYRARVEVFDAATQQWIRKNAASTFFPDKWSRAQVLREIRGAFDAQDIRRGGYFEGLAPSGTRIGGYLDRAGNINTAFPIY